MRVKMLIAGVAGLAGLSACGGSPAPAPPAAQQQATSAPSSAPTTTTVPPTPTTTTTTPPPPPPETTTTTAKPKPATPKPKPAPVDNATPCSISTGACIDLSANKSWLLADGEISYGPVPITHGRKGYRTPPGTFKVSFKDIDHKSSIFNDAPMPYSVFFNGGIAFHQGSLSELSHGCIHLSRAAAKTYYNTLKVGSTVQVVR